VDVLAVGRHHHEHDGHDDETDLPRVGRGKGAAGNGQGEEDLVRRVGNRRECIAGEHRERDPLGEQGLSQPVTAHGPTDEEPFDDPA